MSHAESRTLQHLRQLIGARPPAEFIGRRDVLELLKQAARDALIGPPRSLAIAGPPGAGKSELLRQAYLALSHDEPGLCPLYLALPTPFSSPANGHAIPRHATPWLEWIASATRQALARVAPPESVDRIGELYTSGRLAAGCIECGLAPLAKLLDPAAARDTDGAGLWRALLRALRQLLNAVPVVMLDGAATLDPAGAPALHAYFELQQATLAEGMVFIAESPAASLPLVQSAWLAAERVPLSPLGLGEAAELTNTFGHARGWTLGPICLEPLLPRLGPWPGWVLAWAGQLRGPLTENPIRSAEEAYLRLLTHSAWAHALEQAFEAVVPLPQRDRLLRLLDGTTQRHQPGEPPHAAEAGALPIADLPVLLGLSPAEADRLLQSLLAIGLIGRAGGRLTGPPQAAVAHWVRLALDPPAPGGFSLGYLNLLTQLLAQPRPSPDSYGYELRDEPALSLTLEAFRGQIMPEVLFDFAHYHEAVGRLSTTERREIIARATHTLRLPETVGVARWPSTDPGPAAYVARAYQEGKYQRSHEQTWLIADLSTARVATTPEIQQALELFRRIEREQGPGRYFRWIVIGEGASAEALDLIRREKLFCSCREQLVLIHEILAPREPRVPPIEAGGHADRAHGHAAPILLQSQPVPRADDRPTATPFPAEPPPIAGPARNAAAARDRILPRGVIDMADAQNAEQSENSRLSLPAREGSEYISALMAEKLALRNGFDAASAGKIKTAVLEGVLNAIEHSPNAEKMVDVSLRFSEAAMEIVIENEGQSFDPLAVPEPEARIKLLSSNKRGWGISLMKQFMDEVTYDPCERGTRLRLVKRRAKTQRSEAAAQRVFGGKLGI